MLTPKGKQLLDFLESYYAEAGFMPSYREMQEGVGLNSKSSVFRLLKQLEERGVIRKRYRGPRSVQIVPRIEIDLGNKDHARLDALVRTYLKGVSRNEVASNLIKDGIKRAMADGIIK